MRLLPLDNYLDGCEAAYSGRLESQVERRVIGNVLAILHKGGGIMSKEKKEATKGTSSGTGREATQEEIRALAYQLFCEQGCEHGHDVEHWVEAERRVLSRHQDN